MRIDPILVSTAKVADHVPVISSVTNLIELIAKAILHFVNNETVRNSPYYKHLQQKSIATYLLLIFLPIGDGIYILIKRLRAPKSQPPEMPKTTPPIIPPPAPEPAPSPALSLSPSPEPSDSENGGSPPLPDLEESPPPKKVLPPPVAFSTEDSEVLPPPVAFSAEDRCSLLAIELEVLVESGELPLDRTTTSVEAIADALIGGQTVEIPRLDGTIAQLTLSSAIGELARSVGQGLAVGATMGLPIALSLGPVGPAVTGMVGGLLNFARTGASLVYRVAIQSQPNKIGAS